VYQQEENVQGNTIVGTERSNIIEGTNHAGTILGLALADKIYAKDGDDLVQVQSYKPIQYCKMDSCFLSTNGNNNQ
jgi:hypothetical protein